MIILTGASGGIGRAILPLLAVLDHVVAVYRTKPPDIDTLSAVTAYRMDLSSEEEVDAFATSMKARSEKITLVHAAALSRDGLAAQFSTEDWDHVMEVNLRGNFILTRALLMAMVKEKWGRIIHFSSVAGMRGVRGTIAYSTAKTGLLGMSRVIAQEYGRFGITSNVLVLGYFDTGLIETLGENVRKDIVASIPSGRLGDPVNIAQAVEFLMKADYVNGATIHIDGGM